MAGADDEATEFFAELERRNRGDDAAQAEPEDFGFDDISRDDAHEATGPPPPRAARLRAQAGRRRSGQQGARGPRRPRQQSPFADPRIRLLLGVALLAVVIAVVVLLVRNYERNRLVDGYTSYVTDSGSIVQQSAALGPKLITTMQNATGQTSTQLKSDISALDTAAASQLKQAQGLDVPTGATDATRALVLALQYRESGLHALATNLTAIIQSPSNSVGAASIATSMQQFLASDVIVQNSYLAGTAQALRNESITGVSVVPTTSAIFLQGSSQNDVLPQYANSLLVAMQHQGNVSSGQGAPVGLSLVSVVAEPGGTTLTPGVAATLPASSNLHWAVTVQNGGSSVENNIKVTASLRYGASPVDTQTNTIKTINPGQQLVIPLAGPQASAVKLGTSGVLHVAVATLQGEQNTANNVADYPITITFN